MITLEQTLEEKHSIKCAGCGVPLAITQRLARKLSQYRNTPVSKRGKIKGEKEDMYISPEGNPYCALDCYVNYTED
ncbi:MAG TPA: hypothetical protein VJK51_03810 [Candidatus Nanoarchaeia archaeon]|nr:hypothetical protein [Candidatus Nanoarchaeia archaeon]